jgi:hypothetical protein
MSNKFSYLTGSLEPVEQLRVDAQSGNMKFYDIPSFPAGIVHPDYVAKCSSFVAAVSGSGSNDYLVIMGQRPDYRKTGDGKVMDMDTWVYCFKSNSLEMYPTGVALSHQNFDGRTTELPGYESLSLTQTVNDLHSKLITNYQPLSGSEEHYLNAIRHSISQLDKTLGPQISGWNTPIEVQKTVSPSEGKQD